MDYNYSWRQRKNSYAPGIATYGIDGKIGDTGIPGNSIFFTDYNIKNPTDFKDLVNKITSRKVVLKTEDTVLNRQYINGDCFILRSGEIYRLKDILKVVQKK